MSIRSVKDVVQSGLCIGCGVCDLVCPREAISIVFDQSLGLYRPEVNEKCNECGLCIEPCFGANTGIDSNTNLIETSLRSPLKSYIGFAKDGVIRYKSASGGVVTSILSYLLDNNEIDAAIVTDFNPRLCHSALPFLASNNNEIRRAMGSKYTPSLVGPTLKQLEEDKTYAFVGLPCHIYSLKVLQERKIIPSSIKYFVSLFCGGTLSIHGTDYVLHRQSIDREDVTRIQYRGDGWPGLLKVQTSNKLIRRRYTDYWPEVARWFYLNRCLICIAGFGLKADISCGDFWIDEVVESDNSGTSVFDTYTIIGESIIQKATERGYIHSSPITWQSVKKSQRMMIESKHMKLGTRLTIMELMRKNHPYKRTDIIHKASMSSNDILEVLFMKIGRYLARVPRLWFLLRMYSVVLDTFFNMTQRIREFATKR
ncbi:MAG: Coenzyme F420 hydrogenase/dehydrogenase, beta subunit C-terminal domain [Candidatus Thorarchaeota archaeon]